MKLVLAFNSLDLEQSIALAQQAAPHVSMYSVGSLLIYKHGVQAVASFKDALPNVPLIAEAQILERPRESVTLFADAGASWISVMAGADKDVIQTACSVARSTKAKILLDLADASSLGQSSLEAKNFGAEALTFHRPRNEDEREPFSDQWSMVQGNTSLPVFISGHVSKDAVGDLLGLEPAGIIVGSTCLSEEDPLADIAYYAELVKN